MRTNSKAGHEPQNQAPAPQSGAAGAPSPSGDVSCDLSQAGAQPDPVTLTEDLWAKIAQDLPPPAQVALAQTSQALKAATEKPLWSSFRNRFYPGPCFTHYTPPQLASREALVASNRRWQSNDLRSQTRTSTLLPNPAASVEEHETFKGGPGDVALCFLVQQGRPFTLTFKQVMEDRSIDLSAIMRVLAHPAGHQMLYAVLDTATLSSPTLQETIYRWQPLGELDPEASLNDGIEDWSFDFHPARSNWLIAQGNGNACIWDTAAQKESGLGVPFPGRAIHSPPHPVFSFIPPRNW